MKALKLFVLLLIVAAAAVHAVFPKWVKAVLWIVAFTLAARLIAMGLGF